MADWNKVKTQIENLIDISNVTTGNADTNLTDCVDALIENYGKGGIDTSDANATESDMLEGKTGYVNGEKVTGNIPTKTANDLTASGAIVTVPSGYYSTEVKKSVSITTQATPNISVNENGEITATATQTAGYVAAGSKSTTHQLDVFDGSYECSGDSTGESSDGRNIETCTLIVRVDNTRYGISCLSATTFDGNEMIPYTFSITYDDNGNRQLTIENVMCNSVVTSSSNISISGQRLTNVELLKSYNGLYMHKVTAKDGNTAIIEYYNND